jgi:outer membrane protein
MYPVLDKYAKENQFALIIDVSQQWPQGSVLWADPSRVDITKAVVDAYNVASGVPAPPPPAGGVPSAPRPGTATPAPAPRTTPPATRPPVKPGTTTPPKR